MTSGVDVITISFRALGSEEQEDALKRCQQIWIDGHEGESETGQAIHSLRRAAEIVGGSPGIDQYKQVRKELAAQGEELLPPGRILRSFQGSWHLAREAIVLAETTTSRRIEERFRKRQLGKVWRYTEETLRDVLARCVDEIGHLPQQAEFEWWRQRELELAHAQGEELHLPSPGPYRRRWKTWEAALRHFGYSEAEISGRLERG